MTFVNSRCSTNHCKLLRFIFRTFGKKTRKNIAGWLACFSRLYFIVKSANQNAKCFILVSISLPSSKHFCRESLGSVSYAISRRSRCRPNNSCPSVLPSRSFSKTVHYFFLKLCSLVEHGWAKKIVPSGFSKNILNLF